ncbi:hypothetical protein GOBAR_AA38063 [Gossypium barbadense]|uniref:Uncharacterized protein n=1 Tax=Gossypium barbadense TaxID=3634 RepID=A0A2P5VUY4_GOSBA|nr:hypothetical protein GOBAR_AA38063 [Gossypium barbadense]
MESHFETASQPDPTTDAHTFLEFNTQAESKFEYTDIPRDPICSLPTPSGATTAECHLDAVASSSPFSAVKGASRGVMSNNNSNSNGISNNEAMETVGDENGGYEYGNGGFCRACCRDEKKYKALKRATEREISQSADVICCTCVGAGDPKFHQAIYLTHGMNPIIDIEQQLQVQTFVQLGKMTPTLSPLPHATEPVYIIPLVLGAKQVMDRQIPAW